jgi:hypothetical protein
MRHVRDMLMRHVRDMLMRHVHDIPMHQLHCTTCMCITHVCTFSGVRHPFAHVKENPMVRASVAPTMGVPNPAVRLLLRFGHLACGSSTSVGAHGEHLWRMIQTESGRPV